MHHMALLKFWVERGIVIDDVHTVFSFEQSCWLEKYINGMAKQRAKVKGIDDVLAEIIKLAMNALYGKFL